MNSSPLFPQLEVLDDLPPSNAPTACCFPPFQRQLVSPAAGGSPARNSNGHAGELPREDTGAVKGGGTGGSRDSSGNGGGRTVGLLCLHTVRACACAFIIQTSTHAVLHKYMHRFSRPKALARTANAQPIACNSPQAAAQDCLPDPATLKYTRTLAHWAGFSGPRQPGRLWRSSAWLGRPAPLPSRLSGQIHGRT